MSRPVLYEACMLGGRSSHDLYSSHNDLGHVLRRAVPRSLAAGAPEGGCLAANAARIVDQVRLRVRGRHGGRQRARREAGSVEGGVATELRGAMLRSRPSGERKGVRDPPISSGYRLLYFLVSRAIYTRTSPARGRRWDTGQKKSHRVSDPALQKRKLLKQGRLHRLMQEQRCTEARNEVRCAVTHASTWSSTRPPCLMRR